MIRVSTFGTHELSLFNSMQTQARLQEQQIAVTTGMKAQDYAGLNVDARRLLSMESTVARLDAFGRNIDAVERRLQNMETSVAQIHDIAVEAKTLLVNALSGDNARELQLHVRAQDMMDQVASLLNVKFEERYLFGGGRTDRTPVDMGGYDPAADPDGYYQGDANRVLARIDEAQTMDYTVTADEAPFRELFHGLQLAIDNGVPGAIDTSALETALSRIDTAVRDVPDVRGRIGAHLSILDTVRDKHQQMRIYAEETITLTEATDLAETMTRISADQVLLESSYALTARLSRVSLVNFLR